MLRVTAGKKPFKFTDSLFTRSFTLSNGDLIVTTEQGKFGRYVLANNDFKKYSGHDNERQNPRVAHDKTLANQRIYPLVNGAFLLPDGALATSSRTDGIRIWDADTCELKQHIPLDFSQLLGVLDDQLVVATDEEYVDKCVFHLYRKNSEGQYVFAREVMDTTTIDWKPGHLYGVRAVKHMVGKQGIVQYLGLIGPEDNTVVCYWDKEADTVTKIERATLVTAFQRYMAANRVAYIQPHLLPDGKLFCIATMNNEFLGNHTQWYFLLDPKTQQVSYFGKETENNQVYISSTILSLQGKPVFVRLSNDGYYHFLSGFEPGRPGFGSISTYPIYSSRLGSRIYETSLFYENPIVSVGTLPDDRIFVRSHEKITMLSLSENGLTECGQLTLEKGKSAPYCEPNERSENFLILPLATGDFYGESPNRGRVVWDGKTGKLQQLTELGKASSFSDHPHPLRDGSIFAYTRRGQKASDYEKVQAIAIKKDPDGVFSTDFTLPQERPYKEWRALWIAESEALKRDATSTQDEAPKITSLTK